MANDALAQKAQNFTNRGRQALEARRYDLAVELLSQALDAMPDLLETRRLLRAAQIAKFRENPPSGFALKLQSLSNMGKRAKILSLVKKGKGDEAMAEAEKLPELSSDDLTAAPGLGQSVAQVLHNVDELTTGKK